MLSHFFLFSSETRLPVFSFEPYAFLACLQKLLTPLLTERQCTRQQKDTYQLDSHKELRRVRFQLILAEVSVGSRRQGNFLRVKHRSWKGIPLFRHSLRLGWWFPIIKMFNVSGQNSSYFSLTGLHQPNHGPDSTQVHKSAHAISLIGPWASVQRIDYESHPLISRGLKSAFALNEVTFAWLSPSHIPWPWRVTTGRSMCIFLYVQAMMWEEINGNGTDQNGRLDIWLSDISDTSIRRPAVASSVNCQFHLSEVMNITVSWGSSMQL